MAQVRLVVRIWLTAALLVLTTGPLPAVSLEPVTILEYTAFTKSGPDSFRRPTSVAVFADGTLAILDQKTEELSFIKENGRRIRVLIEANEIHAHDEILYVSTDQRILRFDSDGREFSPFADRSILPFARLRGMDIDARGNLFVADEKRDKVFILSPDGLPLGDIGIGFPKEARLSGPTDVALDHRGHVYILDAGNDRIAVYSVGNHYLRQMADMKNPLSITTDTYGLLYAADGEALRINRYEIGGAKLGAFGAKGRGRGQFRHPVDISVGPDGLLRVLDHSNLSLHTLTWPVTDATVSVEVPPLSVRYEPVSRLISGNLIGITKSGDFLINESQTDVTMLDAGFNPVRTLSHGDFRDPVSAAEGDDGRIYILDRGTGQVGAFDNEGRHLFNFGQGSRLYFFRGGDGKLIKPNDIAVAATGIVAVADVEKVDLFGPDGTYLFSAGAAGKEPGELRRPVAVAFDGNGSLFVADASNRTVSKYNDRGGFTGQSVGGIDPLAMASDKEGRIYVLDDNGPRIRIFSDDLEPLMTVGTEGWDIAALAKSRAMALSGDVLWISKKGGQLGRFHIDLPLRGPRDVKKKVSARSVLLSWNPSTKLPIKGYRLALTNREVGSVRTIDVSDNSVDIGRLTENTPYALAIRTLNGLGHPGPFPTVIEFQTPRLEIEPPLAPSVRFGRDAKSVRVEWMTSPGKLVAKYAIEGRKTGDYIRLMVTPDNFAIVPAGGWLSYRILPMTDDGKTGTPSEATFHIAAQAINEMARGDMRLAAEYFWRATDQEPDQMAVWSGLGKASEELERFPEAEQAYRKALDISPGNPGVLLGLARLALLRNQPDEAAACFEQVKSSDGSDADYLYVSGMIDLAFARYDTAVASLAAAVSIDPSSRNRRGLGRAREEQRQFGQNRPRIELVEITFEPIFPAFYKDYMTRPIGSAVLVNTGDAVLERINFAVFIRNAMDFPTDKIIEKLSPGESILVPIHVDLSNSVLEATEDDTKQAELRLTYFREGEPVVLKTSHSVKLYARNALRWDDPARLASFVTVRDPVVADWARNIAGYATEELALPSPIRRTILLRAALRKFGLSYIEDPTNPYSRVSEEGAIDHVQLPEETLRRKSGDCDDLVVLLASLLENLGVRTAFLDLPGHILLLVDSELPYEAVANAVGEIPWVEVDGNAWLPIEATLIDGSTLEAVRAGATEWNKPRSKIIDLEEAWKKFPPVTNLPTSWRAEIPDRSSVITAIEKEDAAWRRRIMTVFMTDLEMFASDTTEFALQKAALHARFGFYVEAESVLAGLAPRSAAVVNNLGNIRLLQGDVEGARALYQEASALDPYDAGIASNLSRVERAAE